MDGVDSSTCYNCTGDVNSCMYIAIGKHMYQVSTWFHISAQGHNFCYLYDHHPKSYVFPGIQGGCCYFCTHKPTISWLVSSQ
jgi:hypothetical protein